MTVTTSASNVQTVKVIYDPNSLPDLTDETIIHSHQSMKEELCFSKETGHVNLEGLIASVSSLVADILFFTQSTELYCSANYDYLVNKHIFLDLSQLKSLEIELKAAYKEKQVNCSQKDLSIKKGLKIVQAALKQIGIINPHYQGWSKQKQV